MPRRSRPATPAATAAPSSAAAPRPALPKSAEGAALEQRLAGRAQQLVREHRRALGERRGTVTAVRDLHLRHAAALLSPQPTSRAPDGTAEPTPVPTQDTTVAAGLDRLVDREGIAATRHRDLALATSGFPALLWASLSVSATSCGDALQADGPVPVADSAVPRPLPAVSDVAAITALVKQLHAMVYGYQLAIGQLRVSSRGHDVAVARLRAHRVLRDGLVERLVKASAKVPVAEPAYVPSVRPRSPASAGRLLARMEAALAPFAGLWLAATGDATERSTAFTALEATVAAGRTWGAPLVTWPGWPR